MWFVLHFTVNSFDNLTGRVDVYASCIQHYVISMCFSPFFSGIVFIVTDTIMIDSFYFNFCFPFFKSIQGCTALRCIINVAITKYFQYFWIFFQYKVCTSTNNNA